MIIVSLSSPPLHTHTYIGRRDLIPNPIHIPDGALAGVRKSISPRIFKKEGELRCPWRRLPPSPSFFLCAPIFGDTLDRIPLPGSDSALCGGYNTWICHLPPPFFASPSSPTTFPGQKRCKKRDVAGGYTFMPLLYQCHFGNSEIVPWSTGLCCKSLSPTVRLPSAVHCGRLAFCCLLGD